MRSLRTALVCAVLTVLSACSVPLQHDLSEEDANEIYVLLQHAGIDANKLKEGEGKEARFIIQVPKADIAFAAQLLRDNSLPRRMADGLAIFKQTKGMIPTQTEERAMFMEALGGELSNALNRVPGVLEARVVVMIPEQTDLAQPENRAKPSASVFVKWADPEGTKTAGLSADEVREFVARAVPDLVKDNVKVLTTFAKPPKEDKEEVEQRMTTRFGVRLEKASVGTFVMWIALPTLLFLATAAGLAFMVIRRPTGGGGNGNGRKKPQPAAEG